MLHRHVINVGVLAVSLAAGLFAYQIEHQSGVPAASRHIQSLDANLVADVGQDRTDAWIAVQRGNAGPSEQTVANPISAQTIKAGPAPTVPGPAAVTYSPGSIQQIIVTAFTPLGPAAVDWALRVAKCESGYNPKAYNPSGAMGLFQIMPGTWRGTPQADQDPYDPTANANAAAFIYRRSGPGQWVCQ